MGSNLCGGHRVTPVLRDHKHPCGGVSGSIFVREKVISCGPANGFWRFCDQDSPSKVDSFFLGIVKKWRFWSILFAQSSFWPVNRTLLSAGFCPREKRQVSKLQTKQVNKQEDQEHHLNETKAKQSEAVREDILQAERIAKTTCPKIMKS